LTHTDTRRLFTETQRLAMIARDGGCTFPGCDVPPAWTQAHHITDHARGGPTTIANGTLVCGHHHRTHTRQGWRSVMTDGRPAWLPPPWLDPKQRPRTNPRTRPG
ncbi:HNH endonuclease, partial [Jatrophihabitans endophyticus]